jgi:hypothetical protein
MKGGKTMKIREQRVSLFYAGNKKFIVFFFLSQIHPAIAVM